MLTVATGGRAGRRPRPTPTTWPTVVRAAAARRGRGAGPHPGAAAGAGPGRRGRRRRPRPGACCSTRWSRWSPGRRRRPRRWPGSARDPSLLTRRPGRPARPSTRYEVQFLLDAPGDAVDGAARRRWPRSATRWSSSAPARRPTRPPTWNVHVHVNDVGAAIEAGVGAGRPYRISVTRFADQIAAAGRRVGASRPRGPRSRRARLGGGRGRRPGLAALFAAEGAVVVDGGPTSNPSTAEVLAAIRATGAGRVVVLPNDRNVHAVAGRGGRGGPGGRHPGRRGADPVAGAGAGRARRPRPGPAVRRRRDRDGRGGRRLPVRRGRPSPVREALTVAGRCRAGRRARRWSRARCNLIGARPAARPARPLLDRMLGRRRRAGHPAGRGGRAGRARPTQLTRAPRPALAVRRGRRCTTAASRTTRCWSGSNDRTGHAGHAADQAAGVGPKTAKALRDALRPADRRRPALPLPAPVRRARRAHRHRQPATSARRSRCWPRCSGRPCGRCSNRAGLHRWRSTVGDGSGGTLTLTFFAKNQARPWRAGELRPGRWGLFAGKVDRFRGKRQLTHPDYVLLDATTGGGRRVEEFAGALIPVYPATAGPADSWQIARCVGWCWTPWTPPADPMPAALRARAAA